MTKRRKFTDQADGNDRSKLPRTPGDGVRAAGTTPRKDQLAITDRDGKKLREGQPDGWGGARVHPHGRRHGPAEK